MDEPVIATTRRNYLVLLEVTLALVVTFLASLLFGLVAFLVTAAIVEEDGAASLLRNDRRMSIVLTPSDSAAPPEIERTLERITTALGGADIASIPDANDGWRLLAWFDDALDADQTAQLIQELRQLGWDEPLTTISSQSRLVSVTENPHKMKIYIPAGMTIQGLFFIAAAALILLWRRPPPVAPAGSLGQAAIWGALAAFAAFAASGAISGGLHLAGVEVEEQAWIQALFSDSSALLALSPWLVVIGPVSEEVFFRGYVFRRVFSTLGPAPAYAVSALLFALIHAHPVGFPMYILIGLVFAWVYQRTGNLWAPIFGHVIYNGLVLAMPFLVSWIE